MTAVSPISVARKLLGCDGTPTETKAGKIKRIQSCERDLYQFYANKLIKLNFIIIRTYYLN